MHLFISIIFSLLVITGLQVSVESTGIRSERNIDRPYRSVLTVPNGGRWGSWGPREMCPTGTYAAGFGLKVEYPIPGDDTALNAIRLRCTEASKPTSDSDRVYTTVRSAEGSWGLVTANQWCPSGFLTGFRLKVEGYQGHGDDTAANNIEFKCNGGVSLEGAGTNWGTWGVWSNPCDGKGICGIQTLVEGNQGTGDDTALNDVRMYCCD